MYFWKNAPLLRIIIPFISGILFSKYADRLFFDFPFLYFWGIITGTFIVIILFSEIFPYQWKYKYAFIKGIFLHLFIFCMALGMMRFHPSLSAKDTIDQADYLEVYLNTPLTEKAKTYKAEVSFIRSINKEVYRECSGKAFVYFKKNQATSRLKPGEHILLYNTFQRIKNRGNPGEFDYASFCANKDIFYQAFIRNGQWKKTGKENKGFMISCKKFSEKIRRILEKNIYEKKASAVGQALLVGYKQELDRDTYESYVQSGLVHLIAISGLHMGIFYQGSLIFLGFLPFLKRKHTLKVSISLLLMFGFACLTGFPPSVQRASLMFIMLGIGSCLGRPASTLNMLAGSALILLCYNPRLIYEVGFQLSYAAVFGILLMYKPLLNIFSIQNKVLKYCYEILCVSISAQIFTLPFSLYYFHNLPLLFWIMNIVAIPVVTVVIYSEIILILFSFVPMISKVVGGFVSYCLTHLNQLIAWTSKRSFVSIRNIYLSFTECLLLISILSLLTFWVLHKNKKAFIGALLFVTLFSTSRLHRRIRQMQQQKLIIYNAGNKSYMEYLYADRFQAMDVVQDSITFEAYIRTPSHTLFGIRERRNDIMNYRSHPVFDLFVINQKIILRTGNTRHLSIAQSTGIDYLILTEKYPPPLNKVIEKFHPKELILDGSVAWWKIDALKKEAKDLALPVHFISDGAKIIHL